MKTLKIKDSIFSLEEHLENMNIGPFEKPIELPETLYETLHIVDTFDKAIEDISSMIIDGYDGKEINLIEKDNEIYWPTNIWYFQGDNHVYSESTKPNGSIEIYIELINQEGNNSFMYANPQEKDKEHIIISLNIAFLKRLYDCLPPDEVKTSIIQALKHEFKHVRTIWSKVDQDVLYSKKYASNPIMSKFEVEALRDRGYNIVITKKLCYFLNPEEALAHINGIFAKIQNIPKEELEEIIHELNQKFPLSPTRSMSKLIEIFDKDYYFYQLSDILKEIENEYKNNINLQYELYNFQFHTYKLGFYYSFFKKNKLSLNPEISIKEFSKKDEDERFGYCLSAIQIIKYNIAEIKRKLISAVSNYIDSI